MKQFYAGLILLLSLVNTLPALAQCPLAASCVPGAAPASNASLGLGIYRVQLAGLDTLTNGASNGYQDYSCRRGAALVQNTTYTLRVKTSTQAAENVVAWLDYNNDGSFGASEQILYSLNAFTHAATFTVPATATLGQPLRLRIAADNATSPVPTACSTPQYSQTEDYQVRIAAGNPAPVARFATPDSVTCTGVVAFRDASRNAPASWRWSFGDGGTSTQQHPTHTYAAPGTYTVKLRVCSAGGCDSLTRPAYVQVRNDGPRPASCQPATVAYCCQYGLTRVQLAGLDQRSADGQAGYEDFSCASRATLTADWPYTLQLTTGSNITHDVRVYLDLNDDGAFTGPGELLYYGYAVRSPSVPLTVPSTATTVYNKALRLRIVADYANSPATGPCGPVQWGQAEDYSIVLQPNTAKPKAAFTLSYDQYCGPTKVAMANTTLYGASSYAWDFGDGSTSTLATPPVHTYAQAGMYEVRLVAQNAFGRDTARQRVAAAAACPSYCAAGGNGGYNDYPAYFTRLQFAGIDNSVFRGPYVGYRDFTAQYATVQAGQVYPFRAESLPWLFSSAGPWNAVEVWIDANQDGQFVPAERTGPLTQFSPHQLSIRIPANAKPGATRLRAYIHSSVTTVYPNGCVPSYVWGSVEDYTLIVLPTPVAPTAGFRADLPAACNGLVQFRDTSWAAPSAWQWSFGDGTSSTQQHPLHQYAAPGTYSVSLQASNAYGAQTITRPNYVTVSALAAGPRPAACLPAPPTGVTGYSHGIDTLQIGSAFLYRQPRNALAYRDETCTVPPIALTQGSSYPLKFKDTNMAAANCFIWLDANNNGVFESPAELVFNSLTAPPRPYAIEGTLQVPPVALLNQPLRMRVAAWSHDPNISLTAVPDPCKRDVIAGQVRDFSVVLTTALASKAASIPADWQLVPNPSTGLVSVLGAFTAPTPLAVWDVVGRCVYRATTTPSQQGSLLLDLRTLPRGMYIVRLAGQARAARLVLE
jgi:PKD repeat protein